jgi:hypothetical protein
MPLVRYFLFVGGMLLALLFVTDAFSPKVPVVADRTDADMPIIRIQSARKWPERVVFDTSIPTIVPAAAAPTETTAPPPPTAADLSSKGRAHDALAQIPPGDAHQVASADAKKTEPKPQRKRKIAKRRTVPPIMMVQQQPRLGFGFFGDNVW